MLLPQFTIRNLLYLTAICAVLSLIGRQAYFGAPWAIGATMGVAFIAGTFLLHSVLTLGVALPAYGWKKLAEDHDPFHADPPEDASRQIIAQREGD